MIIGISGSRYSGKFTLSKIFQNLGFCDYNFSVLDEPKLELDELIKSKTGISAFTSQYNQRLLIDDFIYSYKTLLEKIVKDYWLNKLEEKIKDINDKNVIIIRDINSLEEFNWVQSKNIVTIYVTRYNKDGEKILAPNFHEKENDPKLETLADYKLSWPSSSDEFYLEEMVRAQLSPLLEKINNKYGCIET